MKVVGLVFILIVFGFFYLIFLSSVFRIKALSLVPEKMDCGSSDDIKKTSQVLGANFFLLDQQKIAQKINDKFFCIGSLKLSKTIPDKVTLELKGRHAVYNLIPWEASHSAGSGQAIATESGFLVDSEGVIFQKANFETKLQPIFFEDSLFLGKKLINILVKKIIQVLETLKILSFQPTSAKIYANNLFLVSAKPQVTLKLDETLDRQLASLQLIINQAKIDKLEVEFIDLRFDKPVVRYAPKK